MELVHPWSTLWSLCIPGQLYEACASLANCMKLVYLSLTLRSLCIPGQLYEACAYLANSMKLVHPWPTVWNLCIPGRLYEACTSLTNCMKLVHPWPTLWSSLSSETFHTASWVTDCKLFCKWIKLLQQKLNPDCAFQVYGLCSVWVC